MTSLGFENYAEALKIYLSKYREVSCFPFNRKRCYTYEHTLHSCTSHFVPVCNRALLLTKTQRHSRLEVRISNGWAVDTAPPPARQGLAAVVPAQALLHLRHRERIMPKAKASTASSVLTAWKAAKLRMLRTAKCTLQGLEIMALATNPTNDTVTPPISPLLLRYRQTFSPSATSPLPFR